MFLTNKKVEAPENIQGGPRALSAHYDKNTDIVFITLKTGEEVWIPRMVIQGLGDGQIEQLEGMEITNGGSKIQWESLSVVFTVFDLVSGVFGTKAWMDRLDQAER